MDIMLAAILGVVLYLFSGLRVLREYERAVYFFLGRSWGAKGPGLIYLPPLLAKMQKVSLRVAAVDVPPQDVITRDNISIKVTAVLYMRVQEPVKAVIGVENYLYATSQLAQTTLRSVLGETELDELLMNREKINDILKTIIEQRTEDWGFRRLPAPQRDGRASQRQGAAHRSKPGGGYVPRHRSSGVALPLYPWPPSMWALLSSTLRRADTKSSESELRVPCFTSCCFTTPARWSLRPTCEPSGPRTIFYPRWPGISAATHLIPNAPNGACEALASDPI